MLLDYLNSGWNRIDLARIFFLFVYCVQTLLLKSSSGNDADDNQNHYVPEVFGLITLLSWWSLFPYLMFIGPFRDLIEQIVQGLNAMKEFLVVLLIFIYATACTIDARMRMETGMSFSPYGIMTLY